MDFKKLDEMYNAIPRWPQVELGLNGDEFIKEYGHQRQADLAATTEPTVDNHEIKAPEPVAGGMQDHIREFVRDLNSSDDFGRKLNDQAHWISLINIELEKLRAEDKQLGSCTDAGAKHRMRQDSELSTIRADLKQLSNNVADIAVIIGKLKTNISDTEPTTIQSNGVNYTGYPGTPFDDIPKKRYIQPQVHPASGLVTVRRDDDAAPITDEWLLTSGFERTYQDRFVYRMGNAIVEHYAAHGWLIDVNQCKNKIHTRRDVRLLCELLKIELKEVGT